MKVMAEDRYSRKLHGSLGFPSERRVRFLELNITAIYFPAVEPGVHNLESHLETLDDWYS